MKKPLVWTLALGLAALGSGLLLARRTHAAVAADEDAPLFTTQPQGAGRLLQLQAKEPLRGIHWLPPIPGGWALCQVRTQADRQLVALFQEGQLARTFQLPRLEGTTDGFYRQAEIQDAALANGTLLLLVKAEGNQREWPVVMALSPEGEFRWAHRAQADHLTIGADAVWAWGATSAQRLPIALAKEDPSGLKIGRTNLPPPLTWPYEVANPTVLLPTPSGFLLSHAKGLTAWRGELGWSHTPLPTPPTFTFPEPKGALVQCPTGLYWQPAPGQLLKVNEEATPSGSEPLPSPEPSGLDGALLKLLGRDDQGRLWFGLASPSRPLPLPQPPPSPMDALQPPPGRPEPPPPAPVLTPEAIAAYEAHLKAPMDRIYTWKPGDKGLKLLTWSQAWPRLGAPTTLPPPTGNADLRPEALGILMGSDPDRWWLALRALP